MSDKSGTAPRDPLLAIVRVMLGTAMTGALIATAAFAFAVLAMIIWQEPTRAWMAGHHVQIRSIWTLALIPGLTSGISLLAFYFMRHLYGIIGTVGDGDPFVPENAGRLQSMGWISIGIHCLSVPLTILVKLAWEFTRTVHFQFEIPLAGVFLALILFILARIFREGTQMREDLEGTV